MRPYMLNDLSFIWLYSCIYGHLWVEIIYLIMQIVLVAIYNKKHDRVQSLNEILMYMSYMVYNCIMHIFTVCGYSS